MKKNKKYPVLVAVLWLGFLVSVAAVAYLSFQDGEQAKAMGQRLIAYLAQKRYGGRAATAQELLELTYEIRQMGRIGAFFVVGILGTAAIHLSFGRCCWLIRTGITAALLIAIAYFTEKLKIYIPSRHYSYEEMMLSMGAVIMGFVLVSAITLTFQAMKGFFRLVAAVH